MKWLPKYLPLLVFQLVIIVLNQLYLKYPIFKVRPLKSGNGYADIHVMIFIGFGYMMTFPRKYSYSALGFNLLLAALVIQWSWLLEDYLEFKLKDGMVLTTYILMHGDYVAAAVLITFGALLGVASDLQLLFIAIVESTVCCLNVYFVVYELRAADIGRSILTHTFGAYFGLGVSLALRNKKEASDSSNESATLAGPSYFSDVTAMLGTIFLWIYWPSFNSARANGDAEWNRAFINTCLALAASTVTAFYLSVAASDEGKLDMAHIQRSTLAGGVAVGTVCNMFIGGGGAIAIGIAGAFISFMGYKYLTPLLDKIGILDTCGVHNLHGMPGLLSGLLSVLFASQATLDTFGADYLRVFFARKRGTYYGKNATTLALNQLYALAVTLGVALVTGIITGLISRICVFKPLKPKQRYDDGEYWKLP